MRRDFRVIDSDGHTFEPPDLYDKYMDPEFRSRVTLDGLNNLRMSMRSVDGKSMWSDLPSRVGYEEGGQLPAAGSEEAVEKVFEEAFRNSWDAASVWRAQKAEGVDLMVIYGPGWDMWPNGIDPALQAAMVRAYNRWMAEYRADSGGHILGAAPLPLQDVDLALKELEYAYNECGARSFWCRPNPVNGRTLGNAYYDPLYEALQDLDAPLGVHEFIHANVTAAGTDRFSGWVDLHVALHPYEQQMAMLDMIVRGVFDRFPRLRVGYLEAGAAWVPWWLSRIEEHLEAVGWKESSGLERNPVDYFKRNCFVTTECDEELLYQAIERLGDDNILFATDYPHADCTYPGAVDKFLTHPLVGDESKRKILFDNAVRFYGFDKSVLSMDPVRPI